jgi:DnaJ-class molecular chaperone
MAKLSHPDAQIGSAEVRSRSHDEDEQAPDFGEVAAAWRILGDSKSRKRYDRELQYKEWAAFASKYANEKMEEAVPAVARIMDDLALPFLRRTAATTVAVSQVVSNIAKTVDSSSSSRDAPQNENKNLITNTFMNAVRAGQKAGRAIDTLELNEKSAQLSQQ